MRHVVSVEKSENGRWSSTYVIGSTSRGVGGSTLTTPRSSRGETETCDGVSAPSHVSMSTHNDDEESCEAGLGGAGEASRERVVASD